MKSKETQKLLNSIKQLTTMNNNEEQRSLDRTIVAKEDSELSKDDIIKKLTEINQSLTDMVVDLALDLDFSPDFNFKK